MRSTTAADLPARGQAAAFSERLVQRIAGRSGPDRRGFLRGSAIVGAALASAPWTFLTRPTSAYAAVCGTESSCAAGYSVFCCTINGGRNSCPPNSFIGGWWKADNSSFCAGAARYYIDCNAFKNGAWRCHCNDDPGSCDHRRVACNQFRYGQCNTQIPLSSTGPVVCRMVSCTPPWQQFSGACSSSSATDNHTAGQTAPCLAGNRPIGRLDSVTVDRDRVRLRGWALDRDQPSTSLRIAVWYDAGALGVFTTTVARPDVNSAYGVTGAHGFDVTVLLTGGHRTVRVNALNVGPGVTDNPEIGSATVTIPVDKVPVGRPDSVASQGNRLRVVGWTFDPDHPSTSLDVALHVDGAMVGRFPTDQPRQDVNRAFGITGVHGFDIQADAANGRRAIDVYALNAGPGSRHPVIIHQTVEVNPGDLPRGRAAVALDGERAVLTGWAYDPDDPTVPIQVAVYQDDAFVGWFRSGLPRADVNRVLGIPGDHGYQISVGSLPGTHTWKVFAINIAGGASNPLIGTLTARVGDAGGIGRVEEVTVVGSTLRLRGWAFDQHHTSTAIQVGVVVDGGPVTDFPTGISRPDVNAGYHITGAHGFDLATNLAAGRHLITVFAIASAGAALIQSSEVTV
jgi:hypothetical protein